MWGVFFYRRKDARRRSQRYFPCDTALGGWEGIGEVSENLRRSMKTYFRSPGTFFLYTSFPFELERSDWNLIPNPSFSTSPSTFCFFFLSQNFHLAQFSPIRHNKTTNIYIRVISLFSFYSLYPRRFSFRQTRYFFFLSEEKELFTIRLFPSGRSSHVYINVCIYIFMCL